MYLKIKVESEELETIRDEIANLAINVTRKLNSLEKSLSRLFDKEKEAEEQILRRINNEIVFIKERFNVSTKLEVCKHSYKVIATITGGTGNVLGEGTAIKNNIYEAMLTALWIALNREVPEHYRDLTPSNLRHTEQELREVLGCDDVTITTFAGYR